MKVKKLLSLCMAVMLAGTLFCGCGGNNDGRVKITVGEWPDKNSDPKSYESFMSRKAEFEMENPDIEIVPDTYVFSVDTFTAKMAGKQIPNYFQTHFTEVEKNIRNKYVLDLTDKLTEVGWLDYMNPEILELLSDENDRVYGIPAEAYMLGLFVNKSVFQEAGLVNEDGSLKKPNTLEEMAQFAQQIREKTGKAGFVLPTVDNCGGWTFMSIAWDHGVNFMEQEGGKWKATFDTQEMRNALNYYKDLKWKYNAFADNVAIKQDEQIKMFATGQVGMSFIAQNAIPLLVNNYGMNKDDIVVFAMPAGPDGAYSQMGGSTIMIPSYTTPEQLDAIFKWYAFTNDPTKYTDDKLQKYEESLKISAEKGAPIFKTELFPVWSNPEIEAKKMEVREKYVNMDEKNFEDFLSMKGIKLRPEEPFCCQQLYAVLDGCIQEILSNKDADIDALVKKANDDFQVNHLDKQ